MEENFGERIVNMEGKLEAVKNNVRGLTAALIEGFDEMKDVLVKMEDRIEENPRKRRRTASGDKENIIVAGGWDDSVEMFNWRRGTWSQLQSMPKKLQGATSFVYNDHVTIAGGDCLYSDDHTSSQCVDNLFTMYINPNRNLSIPWFEYPVKLLAKSAYHSSVLYNDRLIVTGGGYDANHVSDRIDEVQLVPPYTSETLSRMPEPRRGHCTQLFDDNLLIVGGSTTGRYQDSLSSVVLYDIKKKEFQPLPELPYKVSQMATVRLGYNIVVIGGLHERGEALDTVIMYNVVTRTHHMLPSMRCKRSGCTAVVIGNNIVVLGGSSGHEPLKSVEAFNFESYTWEELPEMSKARWLHTAVVV
ncbi:kelch domain-containing 8B-like isoform X2 [Paramuricea clavata]|uniref:Kelch domain-containing 8B-like isoform X2 n=1 Tax=Paramuricea clavata TaxID=317549 RepID=A0A7D9DZB2_PARCT|nr:kelch domain-containing 8B-like isoform X2 [Paramuricea clavata]